MNSPTMESINAYIGERATQSMGECVQMHESARQSNDESVVQAAHRAKIQSMGQSSDQPTMRSTNRRLNHRTEK